MLSREKNGYREKSAMGSAAWVVVAIYGNEEICPCSTFDINYYDNKFSNSLDRCAEKLAEGSIFLPACRSSFEAELEAVHQLTLHVSSLIENGFLPRSSSVWKRCRSE